PEVRLCGGAERHATDEGPRASRACSPRAGLVRRRLPWNRPGADPSDARELSKRPGVADDAAESLHRARAARRGLPRRLAGRRPAGGDGRALMRIRGARIAPFARLLPLVLALLFC